MGAFSTIVDEHGRQWQIKTGDDNYETFNLGEAVAAQIFPDRALSSKLQDGAYLGNYAEFDKTTCTTTYHQKYVVIKGGIAMCLLEPEYDPPGSGIIKDGECGQADAIALRYGCVEPPVESWTDAAWAEHAKRVARSDRQLRRWAAEDYGKSQDERAGAAFHRFTRSKMKEDGFFRQIMPPTQVDFTSPAVVITESSP